MAARAWKESIQKCVENRLKSWSILVTTSSDFAQARPLNTIKGEVQSQEEEVLPHFSVLGLI